MHVGTSGWAYADWRRNFYPKGLGHRNWLAHYAQHFSTVELNATTYRLPRADAIARWLAAVPDDFRFAVKLSRLITHRRNLGEPKRFIDNYFASVVALKPKIAMILAQFPPYLERDDERLRSFLELLPADYRYVAEFRHRSWYCEETYETLRRHRVALCIHDMRGSKTPDALTADFAYVRLHGPVDAYSGSYSERRLRTWRDRISAFSGVSDVWIYFNNDREANAIRNATTLRTLLSSLA